ncbi:hypothetical protein HUR95_00750 [Caldalkalibacillus thermarum TA2.A1]|uniref:Uncharacterized protein n=1 Tax=Caldalkalibacillus thermarum (strain TA2.A1) TaxID=986075 RepID=A0A8X8I503_CALTT|nr:hypothetical protein [Caldalkalibacillus thermarum]QZT34002.1 hypothetical protein HUR95_00750 [Caldalkalibacillus thermarum TA2.A1]
MSEVKTYKLSPEELEKYRKGTVKTEMEKAEKQELTKEKYLELKQQGKKDKEIAEQHGMSQSKLSMIKRKWDLGGVRVNMQGEEQQKVEAVVNVAAQKEKSRVTELEKEVTKWKEMAQQFKEEVERLKRECESYQLKYEKIKEALKVLL